MNALRNLLAACVPLALLAACGGGDVQDRLDIADPVVRLVHASPVAPNVDLIDDTAGAARVTDAPFTFASEYLPVAAAFADWSVRTTAGGKLVGAASIDASVGTKYSIVVLPASDVSSTVYVIADPFNKPLGSKSTRLRVFNASRDAADIDLYMNAVGTDIGVPGIEPLIAATAYKTSGPASGKDSVDIPAGTYQVSITAAGTKTVLFAGLIAFGDNRDILLAVVPGASPPGGGIRLFSKVDGDAGMIEIPACGAVPAHPDPVCY